MVLKQVKLGRLVQRKKEAEKHLEEMIELIDKVQGEKRSFTPEENKKYASLEKQIEEIDAEFEKEGLTYADAVEQLDDIETRMNKTKGSFTNSSEYRAIKRKAENPLEVRGYRRNERIGNHDTGVTIGDLVTSYVTGRYRSNEVRQAMNTTGSGILVPTEVYQGFIDLLRDQSFLSEATVYPMASKALVIPKVASDVLPHFKAENELIIESAPNFTGVTLEAKPMYALTNISLELIESSGIDIGMAVTQLMGSAVRQAVQTFMLHGGDPLGYDGILNDPSINLIDATTIDYATIGAGIRAINTNNGQPNGLVYNSGDAMDIELLTDTTGQFIQEPMFMQNLNKFTVSGALEENQALVGDLSTIAWGILSDGGLQIDIDKSGDAFKRGQISIRARINSDFALTNPKMLSYLRPTGI
jgi:HK97 family phage major capsid protein